MLEQRFQYCCFRNFRCFSKRKHYCIFCSTRQDDGFIWWHLKSLEFMYSLDTSLNLITNHQLKHVQLVSSTILDAVLPEKGRKNRFSRFSAWIFTLWMDSEIKRTHSSRIRRTLLMSRKLRFCTAGRVRIRGYRWVVGGEWIIERACVRGQVFLTESCSKLISGTESRNFYLWVKCVTVRTNAGSQELDSKAYVNDV